MRKLLLLLISLFLLIVAGFVSAQYYGSSFTSSSNAKYTSYGYQPGFQTYYGNDRIGDYWPALKDDPATCKARQDLILQIAPGGCQPAVVRSDLLADQNVPVFCQIDALQLNPLIDIKEIKNIVFTKRSDSKYIVSTGFHPARAALRTRDVLLGDPLINNIGYVVVVLKKQGNESSLPNFVNVTLTAKLQYESGNAFGVGRTEFVLEQVSDDNWNTERIKNSFLSGKYSIRLDNADANYAYISFYQGDKKISNLRVERGKISDDIYLPGSYCMFSLQAQYNGLEAAQKKARIEITDDRGTDAIDVYENTRFLNDNCYVSKINV